MAAGPVSSRPEEAPERHRDSVTGGGSVSSRQVRVCLTSEGVVGPRSTGTGGDGRLRPCAFVSGVKARTSKSPPGWVGSPTFGWGFTRTTNPDVTSPLLKVNLTCLGPPGHRLESVDGDSRRRDE